MEAKHTEGPWYFDGHGAIWRRPPSDLYENGGGVAGDRPIATVHIGWHHDGANGYPVEANARLIASAPELLEALEQAFDFPPDFFARPDDELEQITVSGRHLRMVRAAIAKARGETC